MPRIIPEETKNKLANRDWLADQHTIQLHSIVEIAKMLSVTPATVTKSLRSHNIRSPSQQTLREASNKRKYGVSNPGAVREFKQKATQTMVEKYGGHNWSRGLRNKRDMTCLSLYGNTNVGKTQYAKDKARETNTIKYGRSHKNQQKISDDIFCKLQDREWLMQQHLSNMKNISEISADLCVSWSSVLTALRYHNISPQSYTHKLPGNIYQNISNSDWLAYQNITLKKSATQIANELNVDPWTVQRHFHECGLTIKIHPKSAAESELVEFLRSLDIKNIQQNTRDVIPPQELDIYLPDYKLAIEYCGLYWHGEQFKSRLYHRNKTIACKKLGIRLITMYDSEWNNNKELVKEKLKHIINKNPTKIYARKCKIITLPQKEKARFFNQTHIQGDGPGSISYGLTHNALLIAAITFIKTKNNEYILNRYSTLVNVVGGFTKLLEHFKRNHNWNTIITFADLRWSQGHLYNKLGFTLDKTIQPEYSYIINNLPVHKFNFRRKYLSTKLKKFDPDISEWENCKSNGIDRIWDCGKERYVMHNQQND